jgi:hypothetical protein
MAQQQAQQQMQDPIIQMQMKDQQLKEQDLQRKSAKDAADIMLKQEQIGVEKERIAAQAKTATDKQKFDALKAAATMRNDKERLLANAGVELLKAELAPSKPTKKGD